MGVERLRRRDFLALLRFVQDACAIQGLDAFPGQVGAALQMLIPNDYYVYAEVDGRTRQTVFAESHPSVEDIVPDFRKVFERHGHENPLVTAHQCYAGALKISDFLSQRRLRRLALYNEFLRPAGVRYQMSVILPAPSGFLRGIIINRGRQDFSERERLLLDLARPHLVQARQNAEILDLTLRALEAAGHEVVCLSGEGLVTFHSGNVSSLLAAYFNRPAARHDRLPDALDQWVKEQRASVHQASDRLPALQPLVVDRGDRRLVIRFVCGGGAGQNDMLLLAEQYPQVPASSLTAIGLSPREAEVLTLAMQGRAVGEIGRILGAAASTVEKHFENIYAKLGVHSRTAAVARAYDAVAAHK